MTIPTTMRATALAAITVFSLQVRAEGADEVRALGEARKEALAHSPFKRPLLVDSKPGAATSGDVYAIVDHPIAMVSSTLKDAGHWCDVFTLQTNIKRCVPSGEGAQQTVKVAITRRPDQALEEATDVAFRFGLKSADDRYLSALLSADVGPVGTSDHRLSIEAVPIDATHTFMHMSYSYSSGTAASLATKAYLATSGRDKVGFSIASRDGSGAPVYVKGVQGIAERNAMRYFLAIEALLKTASLPRAAQDEARWRDYFAALEKYPAQLHELSMDDYIGMKRREQQH